ncbi:MAG: site-2 protease family protein, partial [Egibacteraceae bacterium]
VQPYAAVLGYLGWFNLLLAVFNILPGYPLDGGRLLRSVLWMATGRRHAATRWAARVGQVFALALLLGGVYGALGGRLPAGVPFRLLLSFLVGGGLWGAFIGYFLLRGASQAHRRAVLSEGLASQTARDLMGNVPPSLPSDASLDEVLARLQERPSLLWPVGDPVQGGVRLADLDTVVREEWPRVRLGEIAHDGPGVTVAADTALDEVLERMAGAPGNMLIVTDQGAPVGLLTPSLVGAVR